MKFTKAFTFIFTATFILFFLSSLVSSKETHEIPTKTPISFKWQISGPFGGTVRALIQDPANPSKILIGTNDGQLYVSNNQAKNWKWIPGFNKAGIVIDNFVINPSNTSIIYISAWSLTNTAEGGIFKSIDGGNTWKTIFRNHAVHALAIAPNNPKKLVAGTLDGIFDSIDEGENWQLISPPNDKEIRNIESIAIDPIDSQIIYAGTWHLPWKTIDGGKNWFSIKGIFSQIVDDSDIFSITIDNNNASRIFCSACSGIYQSLDAGKNWTKFKGIPYSSRRTHIIFQHPVNSNTIFAGTTEGLWRTTNNGLSWKLLTSKQTVVNSLSINKAEPNKVIIGTENSGVLISENNGDVFYSANDGFTSRQVSSLVADPMQPGRIFASVLYNASEGGVYISSDNGESWNPASNGLGTCDVYSLFLSKNDPNKLYAATNDGIYITENLGNAWTKIGTGSTAKQIRKKTTKTYLTGFKPTKKLPLLLEQKKFIKLNGHIMEIRTTEDDKSGLLAASWYGLFRTYDTKQGWEKIDITGYQGRVFAIATTHLEPQSIYVGTSNGLFFSKDNGLTWIHIDIEKTDLTFVQEIAINPRNSKMILVGTRRALYITKDGMKTWERIGRGVPYGDIAAIQFNPRNADEILVGDISGGGLYLSRDGANTFNRIDQTTWPTNRIWAATFDLFSEDRIYAGSFSSGILVGSISPLDTAQKLQN